MGREQQAAIDETQEQMRLLEESVDLHLKKAFRRQSILHHPDKVGDNAFTRQKYAQIQAVSRLPPPLAQKWEKQQIRRFLMQHGGHHHRQDVTCVSLRLLSGLRGHDLPLVSPGVCRVL
jgi:hypothetical protein